MKQWSPTQITALLSRRDAPCVSLYLPTHRQHPDHLQDPIRYRNLLAELETRLSGHYPPQEVSGLLESFRGLARDDGFWNHRTDGLALFACPGTFEVLDLQRRVPELLVVAGSFHVKPLLRILQSADRFQILALNRHEAKLYEGNRYALDSVELTNMPSTITDALGEELTEQHLTVGSYGAGAPRSPRGGVAGSGAVPSVHAHGDRKDEVDKDRDRFFRSIDRGILEHHSRPSGLPLILAVLAEYHAPFRTVSHNPFLMEEGIPVNPDAIDLDRLRAEAWKVVEPAYLQRLAGLIDNYHGARSRQAAADDLEQVAKAAISGRVLTLLVEADRQIPGTIDSTTGQVVLNGRVAASGRNESEHDGCSPAQPHAGKPLALEADDILDDLAEIVLRRGGEVIVVPGERMPTSTGLAAIFRF